MKPLGVEPVQLPAELFHFQPVCQDWSLDGPWLDEDAVPAVQVCDS